MRNDTQNKALRTPITGMFTLGIILLMTLPFINTFNSLMTNILLKWEAYRILQDVVVPYEAKVIWGIYNVLGYSSSAGVKGVSINGLFLNIQWNCLGWQSAVFLIATFLGGFQGKFLWTSRLQVILIGILGTYVVNIFRISITGILAVNLGRTPAVFFHDNLALLFLISWFVFFWWFSFAFVLEERS